MTGPLLFKDIFKSTQNSKGPLHTFRSKTLALNIAPAKTGYLLVIPLLRLSSFQRGAAEQHPDRIAADIDCCRHLFFSKYRLGDIERMIADFFKIMQHVDENQAGLHGTFTGMQT